MAKDQSYRSWRWTIAKLRKELEKLKKYIISDGTAFSKIPVVEKEIERKIENRRWRIRTILIFVGVIIAFLKLCQK